MNGRKIIIIIQINFVLDLPKFEVSKSTKQYTQRISNNILIIVQVSSPKSGVKSCIVYKLYLLTHFRIKDKLIHKFVDFFFKIT